MFLTLLLVQHALPVLDPHARDREAGPAGVGAQHAVPPPRAPRLQPEVHRPELRGHASSSGTACSAPSSRGERSPCTASRSRCGAGTRSGRTCTTGWSSFGQARRSSRWADRLRVFAAAARLAAGRAGRLPGPARDRPRQPAQVRHPHRDRALRVRVAAVHGRARLLVPVLLFNQNRWSFGPLTAGTLAIVWSLVGLGALLEGRRWALVAEVARVAVLATSGAALLAQSGRLSWAAVAATLGVACGAWLLWYRGARTAPDPAEQVQTA